MDCPNAEISYIAYNTFFTIPCVRSYLVLFLSHEKYTANFLDCLPHRQADRRYLQNVPLNC